MSTGKVLRYEIWTDRTLSVIKLWISCVQCCLRLWREASHWLKWKLWGQVVAQPFHHKGSLWSAWKSVDQDLGCNFATKLHLSVPLCFFLCPVDVRALWKSWFIRVRSFTASCASATEGKNILWPKLSCEMGIIVPIHPQRCWEFTMR